MGHEQILLTPFYLRGFFPSPVHNPWASTCHSRTSFIHGNLAPHRCLAPLTIILICWPFFQDYLCRLLFILLHTIYRVCSNCERDSSQLHLWKGSKYTHLILSPTMKGTLISCHLYPRQPWALIPFVREINIFGKFPWIINITYRDASAVILLCCAFFQDNLYGLCFV